MPMAQGFSPESPRIHRPRPAEKHLHRSGTAETPTPSAFSGSKSDSRRNTIILMRATLHDRASNAYYGQWPVAFPKE